jgi:hypothetical protein
MPGLAPDSRAICAVRKRFGHMARAQTMCRVIFFEVCRAANAFDDPIDGLVGKT